jgi:hypothetical protein
MDFELTENCYVVARGRDDDKQEYLDLLYEHKNELVLFPENSMRFIDTVTYLPIEKSIVTENMYLVSSYSRHMVWILDARNEWVHPNEQTFGCSIESLANHLLGYGSSIPILPEMKIKELVGGLPKKCKTYQDYIDLTKKQYKEFKYDDY